MHRVAVLIPTLDEEGFIGRCLDSALAFELPSGVDLEILVLDGGSTDRTVQIVRDRMASDSRITLLPNPSRIQSAALNLGIRSTKADYILRLDAHSEYPAEYLRLCYQTAVGTGAENVGGALITMARGTSYGAALVQALTTHPLAIGGSTFRGDPPEGPADTVPYGFFRRDVFDRIGVFDERLVRAQDYELNRRLIAAGGTVWLNPRIRVFYSQQPSFWGFMRKQITREAPYNAYLWFVAPYAFSPRHAVTGIFAAGVLGGLALSPAFWLVRILFIGAMLTYLGLALFAGLQQAWRYRELRHAILMPPAMFLYHFLHGCGVLFGLLMLALGRAPVQGRAAASKAATGMVEHLQS